MTEQVIISVQVLRKINANFSEIYTAIGDGTTISGIVKFADDSSTVTSISANGETLRVLGGNGITSTLSSNDLTLAVDTSIVLTVQQLHLQTKL